MTNRMATKRNEKKDYLKPDAHCKSVCRDSMCHHMMHGQVNYVGDILPQQDIFQGGHSQT